MARTWRYWTKDNLDFAVSALNILLFWFVIEIRIVDQKSRLVNSNPVIFTITTVIINRRQTHILPKYMYAYYTLKTGYNLSNA